MTSEEEYHHVSVTIYKADTIAKLSLDKTRLLPTQTIEFRYDQILAVASKSCATDEYRTLSRGAALIYTTDRKEPYLTADGESVKVIMNRIEQNRFRCELGLNQVGSNRLYANPRNYAMTKKGDIQLINGVILYVSHEGFRKLKWIKKKQSKLVDEVLLDAFLDTLKIFAFIFFN